MDNSELQDIMKEIRAARSFLDQTLEDLSKGDFDEASTNLEAALYLLPMATVEALMAEVVV